MDPTLVANIPKITSEKCGIYDKRAKKCCFLLIMSFLTSLRDKKVIQ